MHYSIEAVRSQLMRRLRIGGPATDLVRNSSPAAVRSGSRTFELSWAGFGKLGRGGLFFVLFFLAFELWDFRKTNKPRLDRAHTASAIMIALARLCYTSVELAFSVGLRISSIRSVKLSGLREK